jgi:hypothetical protein
VTLVTALTACSGDVIATNQAMRVHHALLDMNTITTSILHNFRLAYAQTLQGNHVFMTGFYDFVESKNRLMTNILFSTCMNHCDPIAPFNMTKSFLFPMACFRHHFGTWVGTHLDTSTILTTFSNIQLTTVSHSHTACIYKGDSF